MEELGGPDAQTLTEIILEAEAVLGVAGFPVDSLAPPP